MVVQVKVEFPPGQEVRLLRLLDPKTLAKAEAQAVDRTARNVQQEALEAVSDEMGIPVKKLRKRGRGVSGRGSFGTVSKGRKPTARRLSTTVTGYGWPFNVSRWDAQPIYSGESSTLSGRRRRAKGRRRVVAVRHRAYGREQVVAGTWLLGNGAVVVMSGESFRGVWGPGVGQQMEKPHVMRRLERVAQERFLYHFREAARFLFSAAGARARSGVRGARR